MRLYTINQKNYLSKLLSKTILDGVKSIFFVKAQAYLAPSSRSIAESSHSIERGP